MTINTIKSIVNAHPNVLVINNGRRIRFATLEEAESARNRYERFGFRAEIIVEEPQPPEPEAA